MAMSASSAQAALSWLVLNSAKTVATELKAELVGEKDSTHLTLLAELAGLFTMVTCTGLTFKGLFLEAGGKLTEGGKIVLTGCAAYAGPGILDNQLECVVKGAGDVAGTITSGELKGDLVLAENVVQIKIEPKVANGVLKIVRLEGCDRPDVNQLRGVIYLKDGLGQATTHATKHLFEAGPLTALYIGAHSGKQLTTTKIDGSFWLKLGGTHSGLDWAAMDV